MSSAPIALPTAVIIVARQVVAAWLQAVRAEEAACPADSPRDPQPPTMDDTDKVEEMKDAIFRCCAVCKNQPLCSSLNGVQMRSRFEKHAIYRLQNTATAVIYL